MYEIPINLDHIAAVIKKYRCMAKMSQEALSLAVGKDRSYVSRIESQHLVPSLPMFLRLAWQLDVAPEKMLGEINQKIHKDRAKNEEEPLK